MSNTVFGQLQNLFQDPNLREVNHQKNGCMIQIDYFKIVLFHFNPD